MNRLRVVTQWLEDRTGIESAVKTFLYEDIPASSGWHQVFGSVVLFLFLIQIFTGTLLAFNYAPTPGEAYSSLKFIVNDAAFGRTIRGLHHWGASMIIVMAVLHMAQVFIYGAYKKPREATWMVGVVLLIATMAFGLTGYLLPWDNRAYWGTVVTTQIAGQAPFLGPYIQRLMGAANGVGVVTFARFYAVHVLVLPPLALLLIGFHVYLVRRHGVAPAAGDTLPKKKFFPEQVFKDTVAVFVAFSILFGMALWARLPLEGIADPTDTTFIPRPEWYFLFLFQSLKFFKGSLEPIGSVFLPNLAILALFLVPFLDRGQPARLSRRRGAMGVLAVAAVGWGALTAAAVITTPKDDASRGAEAAGGWNRLPPTAMASIGYFRAGQCSSCHNLGDADPKAGPNLPAGGERKSVAWMIDHFKSPGQGVPALQLSGRQMNTMAAFLAKASLDDSEALADAPAFAVRAGEIYEMNGGGNCHVANGVGVPVAPPLNGLAKRRPKAWIEKHFAAPQAMSPGSIMPPYKFSAADMDVMVTYLLALPGG